ncbi:MAG: glutamine-dependent asparagine synthetase [Satyrvirus sp.]|uniref:asparagine synthase (glutamine-hydrolyzing) n=1 Tax=Satyrvirus sp. TaxID=2487771 RepID=A0A3G5AF76_9VIRU|nr:MAG: glutamine-dependent asparagine synthetase [Satyrvirus sp.]
MCGIFCLVQYGGNSIDLELACRCLDKLVPRGPDAKNYYLIKMADVEIFLGFTRLAIMDTSMAGIQPFHSSDNKIHAICNGEIYNYKELAKNNGIKMKTCCDCEIIIPLYEKLGFHRLIYDELYAEFAMVLVDEKNKSVMAARDRYGVRPLYYGYNEKTKMVGFSSELKALHPVMEFAEQLPPYKYLKMNLDLEKNPYHNAKNMLEFVQYISYPSSVAANHITEHNYLKYINEYLTEAVRKRLTADRPIGFLLSGGLDSSLITAIAARILGPDKIVCFSIGLPNSPDVMAAKEVVSFLGIKKHHVILFDVEKGFRKLSDVIEAIESYDVTTIRASTPQYMMAKYIKENTDIRVLLSGEGSDEIHGSYRYFRDAPCKENFYLETIRLLKDLYMFDNLRTDRTMAAFGLEVRVPFLDYDYVNLITGMDPELLMYKHNRMEKKIIRDSFKGYLPDQILYRPKEAFSDAVSSNEVNWAKYIQKISNEVISDEELINSPFIINRPMTKDALYFRRIFSTLYPGRDNVIPYYWLPKFQSEEVLDPSATVLKCY